MGVAKLLDRRSYAQDVAVARVIGSFGPGTRALSCESSPELSARLSKRLPRRGLKGGCNFPPTQQSAQQCTRSACIFFCRSGLGADSEPHECPPFPLSLMANRNSKSNAKGTEKSVSGRVHAQRFFVMAIWLRRAQSGHLGYRRRRFHGRSVGEAAGIHQRKPDAASPVRGDHR